MPRRDEAGDVGAYCREVEAFLCRRNGGHLVRLVGPAFLLVAGWASQGIPLRVVQHGIERTVTRLEARGPRRRPVRIEFCEADVLDAFDQWRRAVGPQASRAMTDHASPAAHDDGAGPQGADDEEDPRGQRGAHGGRRGPSLSAHLDRVIQRLSSVRAGTTLPEPAGTAIDAALVQLDALARRASGARGEARQAIRDALAHIDEDLLSLVVAARDDAARERLARRADDELRPLRDRLAPEAYAEARARLTRQMARQELGLPEIVLP